jgi:hypothetical protein
LIVIIVDIAIMANTPNFVMLDMGVTFMIFFGTVVIYVAILIIRDMKENCTIFLTHIIDTR